MTLALSAAKLAAWQSDLSSMNQFRSAAPLRSVSMMAALAYSLNGMMSRAGG